MKLTIEIDQPSPQVAPTVRVLADDQPLGLIQRLELELNASKPLPRMMIRFSDLSKLSAASLTGDGGSLDALKNSIAKYKKMLSVLRWLDLP